MHVLTLPGLAKPDCQERVASPARGAGLVSTTGLGRKAESEANSLGVTWHRERLGGRCCGPGQGREN